jgi:hypothetical protein
VPTRLPAELPDETFESGGPLAAVLRMIAAAVIEGGVFDRRSTRVFRALLERSQFRGTKPEEARDLFKQQARLLRCDRDRALSALAVLLPTAEQRRLAVDAVRQVLLLAPDEIRVDQPLARKLSEVLELDLRELARATEAATV